MKSIVHAGDKWRYVDGATSSKLPSGTYSVMYNPMNETLTFKDQQNNHDKIISLPGTAFDQVAKEIDQFLLPETKEQFANYGFLYKRGFLLYGKPGSGKTCIVARAAEKVLASGGLVLIPEDPHSLAQAFHNLAITNSDSTLLVILEEFDQLCAHDEKSWLLLLDGELQTKNVIFMATTNFIEKVPQRILRPGRFSTIVEVGWPGFDARLAYLSTKFSNASEAKEWAQATDGLSIDEIKEVVLGVTCLGQSRSELIQKVMSIKNATSDYSQYDSKLGSEADADDRFLRSISRRAWEVSEEGPY